jgi:hypothetical protein
MKRSLLVGATLATVTLAGIGGVGVVSAATTDSATQGTSIVDKLATKFNLNKNEVQAVFDAEHKERHAEMQAERKERLAEAVKADDITQEQADHITKALAEIEVLRGDTNPKDLSDDVRKQIKEKMDALRDWAEENDVDMKQIGHGGRGHGFGMGGGVKGAPTPAYAN